MSIWTDLPLFPLDTVLFPGMILPLHIFEERYKLMIKDCLLEEQPFGVVLIRPDQERFYDIGTTAVIAGLSHLAEGRMNIVTIGSERFRLLAVREDRPYLVGHAEPWPLADDDGERTQRLVGPLRALFRQYVVLLAQAQGHKIEVEEVPTDPQTLALLVAIALQLPMPQKQHLLAQATVAHLLRAEQAIMRREQLILNYIIQTQRDQEEGGFSGFLSRN